MIKFTAIRLEQFLPNDNKIPDGIFSNGLGDPRKILTLNWVIDTVQGRRTVYNKDWIAYNDNGEKLIIEREVMNQFITDVADPPPNFGGGW